MCTTRSWPTRWPAPDIFKALALGAKAVCLGRVPRWGLGAYGAPGVQRVLEILQNELVAVISKYVSIKPEEIKVHLQRKENLELLEVKIELPDAAG